MIAFFFSLICMLATAVASPYASVVDDYVAKVCGFSLVATFFFVIVIKVSVGLYQSNASTMLGTSHIARR